MGYTGTVWGGPKDGEVITSNQSVLYMPVPMDTGDLLSKDPSPWGKTPNYVTYRLTQNHKGEYLWVNETVLWKLQKGQDIED